MEPRGGGTCLRRTGSQVLLRQSRDGSRPNSGGATPSGGRATPHGTVTPLSACSFDSRDGQPLRAPPSVSCTGRLYSETQCSKLGMPLTTGAENLPSMKGVRIQRVFSQAQQGLPQAVWSDGCQHLGDEPWPAHAVPIFIFNGRDRPRPGYREEFRFEVRDEVYVNFLLRLRCGGGDRYGGGTVGLVHAPDRREATAGSDGQLIMVTDVSVNNTGSIQVIAVGDLDFKVIRAWVPRGMGSLQLAHVEVIKRTTHLVPILETLATNPELSAFGRLVEAAPKVSKTLSEAGPFTLFVPTSAALDSMLGGGASGEAAFVASPDLEAFLLCHICSGKVAKESMYNGRIFNAVDGTIVTINFGRWPRAEPYVNDIPVKDMDFQCTNGIIHILSGTLTPAPTPGRWGTQRPG